MTEETVTISKREYDDLKRVDFHMQILEARGVDNWEGFCGVPDRSDYNTDEGYDKAIQQLFDMTEDYY